MSNNGELMNDIKIGIMGCGHLGQAIAQALARHGFKKENLLISYRGNPLTYQKLAAQGLSSCLTTSRELFQEADIVLITIKPQDIFALAESDIAGKSMVVSCMAGVSIERLQRILETDVYRMMFSGPDTIASGKGVAAMFPEHEQLKLLLRLIKLTHIKTMTENDLDIFTAGVCMPAAILKVEDSTAQQTAIARIGTDYPMLSDLYTWASKALPYFQDNAEKEAYVEKMITKGGVTEAIIKSLICGEQLDAALRKGIARTKEISFEIQQSIVNQAYGKSYK